MDQEIMDQQRTVTIINKSGIAQDYVIFAEEPVIDPSAAHIKTNVIVALRGVAGHEGQAFFAMPKKRLYAMCGTSNSDGIKDLVQIDILDQRAVKLETKDNHGLIKPGTTCDVTVQNGTPAFSATDHKTPLGIQGSFGIHTAGDFSYQEAEEGHFILGLGMSMSLIQAVGAYMSFTPGPSATYKIKPSNTFNVAASGEKVGHRVTPDLKNRACEINFEKLQADDVLLHHDANGVLTIQQKPDDG